MATTEPVWEVAAVIGRLPGASNATLLARLADGTPVVYKPTTGESPLWDFPDESLAIREVLAFEVSEAADLGVVPETRWCDGPHGPGSAQRYVTEDRDLDQRRLLSPDLDERLWPIALLDLVTNNADRKLGHVLPTADGQLMAIDNALSFHPQDKLRTVLWGFAGRELPPSARAAVASWVDQAEVLEDRIGGSLGGAEATAFTSRVDWLAHHPVHPLPPNHRPATPWPLW